jgi:hypothetical protein
MVVWCGTKTVTWKDHNNSMYSQLMHTQTMSHIHKHAHEHAHTKTHAHTHTHMLIHAYTRTCAHTDTCPQGHVHAEIRSFILTNYSRRQMIYRANAGLYKYHCVNIIIPLQYTADQFVSEVSYMTRGIYKEMLNRLYILYTTLL